MLKKECSVVGNTEDLHLHHYAIEFPNYCSFKKFKSLAFIESIFLSRSMECYVC